MNFIKDFREATFNLLEKYDGKALNLLIAGGSVIYCMENPKIMDLDTSQWNIYFSDERITTDPKHINYIHASIFYSNTSANMHILCEENFKVYQDVYKKIDLCFLGIGEDGHIASLFPNSETLESTNLIEKITNSPKFPPERYTVTIKFLNGVSKIYFLLPTVGGVKKAVKEPHESIKTKLTVAYEIFYQK